MLINFHPKLYTRYHNHGTIQAIPILAICQKLKKQIWHFEISLITGPCGAGNFKLLFFQKFHWGRSKLHENIGYHGKSKCLQLAPKILSKLFNIFCTGSSVQAECQGLCVSCSSMLRVFFPLC